MDEEAWKKEVVGQRRITGQFAALEPCEIKGEPTSEHQAQGGGRPSCRVAGTPCTACWLRRTSSMTARGPLGGLAT